MWPPIIANLDLRLICPVGTDKPTTHSLVWGDGFLSSTEEPHPFPGILSLLDKEFNAKARGCGTAWIPCNARNTLIIAGDQVVARIEDGLGKYLMCS